jgi:hypothetical protein
MAKQNIVEIPDPRLPSDFTDTQNEATQYVDPTNNNQQDFTTNEVKITEREQRKGKLSGVTEHKHDGADLERLPLRDLGGFIEVVPAAPTHIPKNFFDQIKIFIDAGTPKLYVYDYVNNTWRVFT